MSNSELFDFQPHAYIPLIFKAIEYLPCGTHCIKYQAFRGDTNLIAEASTETNDADLGALPSNVFV